MTIKVLITDLEDRKRLITQSEAGPLIIDVICDVVSKHFPIGIDPDDIVSIFAANDQFCDSVCPADAVPENCDSMQIAINFDKEKQFFVFDQHNSLLTSAEFSKDVSLAHAIRVLSLKCNLDFRRIIYIEFFDGTDIKTLSGEDVATETGTFLVTFDTGNDELAPFFDDLEELPEKLKKMNLESLLADDDFGMRGFILRKLKNGKPLEDDDMKFLLASVRTALRSFFTYRHARRSEIELFLDHIFVEDTPFDKQKFVTDVKDPRYYYCKVESRVHALKQVIYNEKIQSQAFGRKATVMFVNTACQLRGVANLSSPTVRTIADVIALAAQEVDKFKPEEVLTIKKLTDEKRIVLDDLNAEHEHMDCYEVTIGYKKVKCYVVDEKNKEVGQCMFDIYKTTDQLKQYVVETFAIPKDHILRVDTYFFDNHRFWDEEEVRGPNSIFVQVYKGAKPLVEGFTKLPDCLKRQNLEDILGFVNNGMKILHRIKGGSIPLDERDVEKTATAIATELHNVILKRCPNLLETKLFLDHLFAPFPGSYKKVFTAESTKQGHLTPIEYAAMCVYDRSQRNYLKLVRKVVMEDLAEISPLATNGELLDYDAHNESDIADEHVESFMHTQQTPSKAKDVPQTDTCIVFDTNFNLHQTFRYKIHQTCEDLVEKAASMLEVRPENCVAILKYKLDSFTTISADTPLIDEDPIFVQFYLGKEFINGRTRLMTKLPDFLADISIDDMIGDIPERGEILRKLAESEELSEEETEILNDIISEPLINYIPKRQNTEEERKLYLEQVFKEYKNVIEDAQLMHQLSEAIVNNYRKRLKKRHFFGRRVMKYGLGSVEGNAFERAWKAILAREGEAQQIPTPEEPVTPENEDLSHGDQPGPSGIQSRKNDGKSIREQLQDLEIGKENRTDTSTRNNPKEARNKSSTIRRLDLNDKTSSSLSLPSKPTSNPSGAPQVSRKRQHEENKENRRFEEVGKVNVCVYDHFLQPKGILKYPVDLNFKEIIETIIDCYQLKTRSYVIGIHQVQHGEVREITELTFDPEFVLYVQVYTGQTQIPCKSELSEIPEALKPMTLQFIFDKTTNPSRVAEKLRNREDYTEDELFQISALIGELVHNHVVGRRSTILERKLICDHLLQGFAERNGVGNAEIAKFKSQLEQKNPDGEFKEESPIEFMDRIYTLSDIARKELIKKLDLGYREGEFQVEKTAKRRAEDNRGLVNDAAQTEAIQPAVEQVTQALDNIEMDEVTPERAAELLCGLFGTEPVGSSKSNVSGKDLQDFKDQVIVVLLDENFAIIDVELRLVKDPVWTQMERMLLNNCIQPYHLLAIEKLESPKELKKIRSTSECLYLPCVVQVHTNPWDVVTDELIRDVPTQLSDKSINELLNQVDTKTKQRILKAFTKKDGQLSEDDQRVIVKWCCETWMRVFCRVPQSAERELMFTHLLRHYSEFDAARLFRLNADALASGSRVIFNTRQRRRLRILNDVINGRFEGEMSRVNGNKIVNAKPTNVPANSEELDHMQMEISPMEFNFLVPPMQGHNRILIYTEEKKFLKCICTQSPNTKVEIEQLVAKKMGIPTDHVLDVDCLRYSDNFFDDTFYNTLVFVEVYMGEDPICTMEEEQEVPEVLRSVTFADVINSSGIQNYNGDRELTTEECRRLAAKLAEQLGRFYKKRRPTKNEIELFLEMVFQAKPEIAHELFRQREGTTYHRRALISVQLSIRQKYLRKKRLAYMTQHRDQEVASERLVAEAISNSERPLNQEAVVEDDTDDSDIVVITPPPREPNIQPDRPCTSRRSDGNVTRNEVRTSISVLPSTSRANQSSDSANRSSAAGIREVLDRLSSTRTSAASNPRPGYPPPNQSVQLQAVKDYLSNKIESRPPPTFYAIIGIDLSLIGSFCMEYHIDEAIRMAVFKVQEKYARSMPVVPRIQPRVVCSNQLESTKAENKHKIICIVLDIYGAFTHKESFSNRFEFTFRQKIREVAVNEWRRVVADGTSTKMASTLRQVYFNPNFTPYSPNIDPFKEPTSVDDNDEIQILDVVKTTSSQVGRKSVMAARSNEVRREAVMLPAEPRRRSENVRRTSDVPMISEQVRRTTEPQDHLLPVTTAPAVSLPSSSRQMPSIGNQNLQILSGVNTPMLTPTRLGNDKATPQDRPINAYRPLLQAVARRQADSQPRSNPIQIAPVGPRRQPMPQQSQHVPVGSSFVPIAQFRPNQYGYPHYHPQFLCTPQPYGQCNLSNSNPRIVGQPGTSGMQEMPQANLNIYVPNSMLLQSTRPMIPPQNVPTSMQGPVIILQQQPQMQQPPRDYEPRVLNEVAQPERLTGNDLNAPVLANENMVEKRVEEDQSDDDDIQFVEEITKKYLSTNVMVIINENSELLCHCSINFSPQIENLVIAASDKFDIPRMDVLLVAMFAISMDNICRFSCFNSTFVPSQMFLVGIKQNIKQIALVELKEGDQLYDIYKKYDLAEMVDTIYPKIGQKLRSGETVELTTIQAVKISLEIARISLLHCAFRKFGDFEKMIFFNHLVNKYPNLDTTIFSTMVYESLVPLDVAFKFIGNRRFLSRAKMVRDIFMYYLKSDPGPDAGLLNQPINLPTNVEEETKEVEEWLKKMEAEEARLEGGNDPPDDGLGGGDQGKGDLDVEHGRGGQIHDSNGNLRPDGSDVDGIGPPEDQGRRDGQTEEENEKEDEEMPSETTETCRTGASEDNISQDILDTEEKTTPPTEDSDDIAIVRISLPSLKSELSSQGIDSQGSPRQCSASQFPKEADRHGRGAYEKRMEALFGKFKRSRSQDEEKSQEEERCQEESEEKNKTNDGEEEGNGNAIENEDNGISEEPSTSRPRSLVPGTSFDRMVQRCGIGRHVKRMENIYKDWREDDEDTDQGEDAGKNNTEEEGQEDGRTTSMSFESLGELQIDEGEHNDESSEKNIDEEDAMEVDEAQEQPENDIGANQEGQQAFKVQDIESREGEEANKSKIRSEMSKDKEGDDEIGEADEEEAQDPESSRKSSGGILLHSEEQLELDLLQAADELAESDGLEDFEIDESILDSQDNEDLLESQNDEQVIQQDDAELIQQEEDRKLEEDSLDGELVIDEETVEKIDMSREMERRNREKRELEKKETEKKVDEHGQGEGQEMENGVNEDNGEERSHAVATKGETSLNALLSVSESSKILDNSTATPSKPAVPKRVINEADYIVISDDEDGPSNSAAQIPDDLVEIDSIGPDDQPNTVRVYVINENHRLRAKVYVQIDPSTATVKSVTQKVAEEIKIDPTKVKIVEKIAQNEQVVEASSWSKILVTERPYIMTIYQNEPADSSGFTRLPLGLQRYKWQDILDNCPNALKIMDKINLAQPFSDAEKRELSRAIVVPVVRYLIGRIPNRGEINAFIQHLNPTRHGYLTRELFTKVSRCSSIDYLTDAKNTVSKEFKATRVEAIKKIIALQKWGNKQN